MMLDVTLTKQTRRFNRYIVECKFVLGAENDRLKMDLIDT